MGVDTEAQKKAEAAELYKKFHQEEMGKNGGDAAAAAASAIVRLKERMSVTSATTEESKPPENGATSVDVAGAATNATNGVAAADGATGSPSAADLRERRLQALEEAQAQKKTNEKPVPATTFQRTKSTGGADKPPESGTAQEANGHSQSSPTASAAELRERRLQALEAGQQQKAKEMASHQTCSGFRKREWDSVNVLNNTPSNLGETSKQQAESAEAAELPENLAGVVLAPQGFNPPARTESSSETAPLGSSIVGGVIVKRSVSGTDEAAPESMRQDDEDDAELQQALAMSMDEDGLAESQPAPVAPATPTGQKRKVASEPEDLEALAQKLEKGEVPNPEDVAAAAESLRETAKKLRQLEATAMHFAQTLQVVQMVVARSGLPGLGGESEGPGAGPGFPFGRTSQPEESTKSYLFKRGEQRDEEAEQAQTARTVSFVGSTGTLSPSASNGTPTNFMGTSGVTTNGGCGGQSLSREEMDKQRNERLQRLEAQQADAKREKEAMDAKQRAREAMFNAEGPKKR
eukprot:gnl/MRDRNA2_/MRDRNA2_146675_c0_seq1.p1 gnl/MRDRNA2_/MRDRNA2_146675_c0~~gnl/MRDRNA2_/MRDRNA2_146675_c0_seq1.p1  ORF type:complete len:522 (+),score=170.94 gnl/MRDRNA2_/MRDRNA2_146675_c0_seq1:90-1655(+)